MLGKISQHNITISVNVVVHAGHGRAFYQFPSINGARDQRVVVLNVSITG